VTCDLWRVTYLQRHVTCDLRSVAVRGRLLLEVVSRTLKNILRELQRTWMKSRRTTSEQGMHELVVRFLNLVTGTD
jgi:hypothetical protein